MKPTNASAPIEPKLVACPTCGGESIYAASNLFRPFCSERCKGIDMGAWASESFRVPAKNLLEDQFDDAGLRPSASH